MAKADCRPRSPEMLTMRLKGGAAATAVENITLAVIVTDAVLTKHQANGPAQMSLPVSPPARRVLAAIFVFSVAALVRLATHDGISRTIHYWKRKTSWRMGLK
jgi:L-aminopeptidase/D-esterase-like protein